MLALIPIRRGPDESLYGYEALLRPRHPADRHAVPGSRRRFDAGRAKRRLAAEAASHGLPLLLGLEPSELCDPDLGSASCPLRPIADRVILQIPRGARTALVPGPGEALLRLRGCGFRFAVGGFGTDPEAFASWVDLEPEIIALDRRIVSGLPGCAASQQLAAGAIALARSSGAIVVAKGVECEEQRRACVDLGCALVQRVPHGDPGILFATRDPRGAAPFATCAAIRGATPRSFGAPPIVGNPGRH